MSAVVGFELAVDVGGTFVDLVCKDEQGRLSTFKSPTTPDNLIDGVLNAAELAATHHQLSLNEMLARCDKIAYGSTIGTNAILENRAAKTALICTRGFRETLLIREGGKRDTYNLFVDYPQPYIPRYLTLEVTERVNSEGGIEIPLAEDEVRAALAQAEAWNVQAIAVSLLWSIANPTHERRIGQLIEDAYPGVAYSLSHQVNPAIREYRRTSATAIDASLKPIVVRSVQELERRFHARGFRGILTHVTSSGGQASSEDVIQKPVFIVFSGPSMAPIAGGTLATRELGATNAITIDMGGTSFDVSIITDDKIPMHREGIIGNHMFGVPSVDVKTVGAGGGSIARIDAGGFIHVGPQSAGAVPGPACYRRGGDQPTVTDANLVRGLLDPDYFAGGAMKLCPELAERVIRDHIAVPLNLSIPEAAALIGLACEQNMVAAIEDITMRRGIDPREYVMVAGGAAAGLHAVPIARELGIAQILIPKAAGVMSAFGILASDVKFLFASSFFTSSVQFDYEGVNRILSELEGQAEAYLSRMKIEQHKRDLIYSVEARYVGQVWQLTLPLRGNRIRNEVDLAQLVRDFHDLHEKIYSVKNPKDNVEFVEWDVEAIGRLPAICLEEQPYGGTEPSPRALKEQRRVYLDPSEGFVKAPVYIGEELVCGNLIQGPAIIEEPLTTIALYANSRATVTRFRSYLVELDQN